MSKNPPQNSLTEFQKQNWNASIFVLMAMGVVGVGVNPSKKNPDNRQIPKPVDWRLSGLVKPVTAVAINKMIGPSTSPNPVPTTVKEMRSLVKQSTDQNTGSNSR